MAEPNAPEQSQAPQTSWWKNLFGGGNKQTPTPTPEVQPSIPLAGLPTATDVLATAPDTAPIGAPTPEPVVGLGTAPIPSVDSGQRVPSTGFKSLDLPGIVQPAATTIGTNTTKGYGIEVGWSGPVKDTEAVAATPEVGAETTGATDFIDDKAAVATETGTGGLGDSGNAFGGSSETPAPLEMGLGNGSGTDSSAAPVTPAEALTATSPAPTFETPTATPVDPIPTTTADETTAPTFGLDTSGSGLGSSPTTQTIEVPPPTESPFTPTPAIIPEAPSTPTVPAPNIPTALPQAGLGGMAPTPTATPTPDQPSSRRPHKS